MQECNSDGMHLKEEIEYYRAIKEELLKKYEGKYALIKGKQLIDTYTTHEEAYNAGVEKYGNEAFLIQQILPEEPIQSLPALMLGVMRADQ